MTAARTKDKLQREETVDIKAIDTVFRWTPGGFRSVGRLDPEVEAPPVTPAYGHSLGLKSKSREGVIGVLRKGLPVSSFEKLHKEMGISIVELAQASSISIRTLQRRRKLGRFQTDESDRLLRIGVLFERAVEVLGTVAAARDWMKTPKKALAGKTPLDYSDTGPGAREVEDLLGRIEHGVFS
jgi:putative toxin-antitoxin system antitoxin component (TIGR02293 family)